LEESIDRGLKGQDLKRRYPGLRESLGQKDVKKTGHAEPTPERKPETTQEVPKNQDECQKKNWNGAWEPRQANEKKLPGSGDRNTRERAKKKGESPPMGWAVGPRFNTGRKKG